MIDATQEVIAKTIPNVTPILEVVVGSTVHGTAVRDGLEDLDLMAVVIEDMPLMCGFFGEDTWTKRTKPQGVRSEAGDFDFCAYGLRKFLSLALKGNPSIMLALFAPQEHVRFIDTEGIELRAFARDIVSKQCYAPFRGYMRQQHERLLGLRGGRNVTRPELVDAHGYDTKYAAHIVRLGYQGEEALRFGRISLPMPDEQRERCIEVRTGKYSLAQVSQFIIDAEERLNKAYAESPLPDRPAGKKIQEWMLKCYLVAWERNEAVDERRK